MTACVPVKCMFYRHQTFFAFFEMTESDNSQCINKDNKIQFKNCHFTNIYSIRQGLPLALIQVFSYSGRVKIINCTFVNTSNIIPVEIRSKYKLVVDHDTLLNITIFIKNTSFISNTSPDSLIIVSGVLFLEGPVLFIGAKLQVSLYHNFCSPALIDSQKSNAVIYIQATSNSQHLPKLFLPFLY